MSGSVALGDAGGIVPEMAAAIAAQRAWLSEIDGAIGDGDHGINMSKGFGQAAAALGEVPGSLAHAFTMLGETLLEGIGGSMGPLYGTLFIDMAAVLGDAVLLDAGLCGRMLRGGMTGVIDLGGAKAGDKTMLDALAPACDAFDAAAVSGADFGAALAAMARAAEAGRDATRDMVARIGRAARLGDRSRGTIDAGAASCALLLGVLADGLTRRLV